MEISEVKVFPVAEEKLKAFVSVVFDRCFMVNDIKIIQGRQGLFISMPSRKKKNGDFKDVAHPLNNETRQRIEGKVLAEYDRVLAEQEEPASRRRSASPGERKPAPGQISTAAPIAEARPEPADPSNLKAVEMATPENSDSAPAAEVETKEGAAGKTLEEVQEMHLRDSFWTVP